jgi:hypothetical protein
LGSGAQLPSLKGLHKKPPALPFPPVCVSTIALAKPAHSSKPAALPAKMRRRLRAKIHEAAFAERRAPTPAALGWGVLISIPLGGSRLISSRKNTSSVEFKSVTNPPLPANFARP